MSSPILTSKLCVFQGRSYLFSETTPNTILQWSKHSWSWLLAFWTYPDLTTISSGWNKGELVNWRVSLHHCIAAEATPILQSITYSYSFYHMWIRTKHTRTPLWGTPSLGGALSSNPRKHSTIFQNSHSLRLGDADSDQSWY